MTEAVKRMKGASANAVNHRSPGERASTFAWQAEYGALSFGEKALARVVDYVDHQEERHASGRLLRQSEQADDGYRKSRDGTG